MSKPFHIEERQGLVEAMKTDIITDMYQGVAFTANVEIAKHLIEVHGFEPLTASKEVSLITADALELAAKNVRAGIMKSEAAAREASQTMGKILDTLKRES